MTRSNKSIWSLRITQYFDVDLSDDVTGFVLESPDRLPIPMIDMSTDCLSADFVTILDEIYNIRLEISGNTVNMQKIGLRYWSINKRVNGKLKKIHLGKLSALTPYLLTVKVEDLMSRFPEIHRPILDAPSILIESQTDIDNINNETLVMSEWDKLGVDLAGHGKYENHLQPPLFGSNPRKDAYQSKADDYLREARRLHDINSELNLRLIEEKKANSLLVDTLNSTLDKWKEVQEDLESLQVIHAQNRDDLFCKVNQLSRYQGYVNEYYSELTDSIKLIASYSEKCKGKKSGKDRTYSYLIKFLADYEAHREKHQAVFDYLAIGDIPF